MATGNMNSAENNEVKNPVSPYSRCVGIYEFKGVFLQICNIAVCRLWLLLQSLFPGEGTHDLSFGEGEELTIIEPCNALFWYLAENSNGQRGVIPINYVEVMRCLFMSCEISFELFRIVMGSVMKSTFRLAIQYLTVAGVSLFQKQHDP